MFHYFHVSKNLMPMRGISRFSKEILLSHSTEKLRRGTFLCFTIFLVSEKLMDRRGRAEDVSRYSVKFFCLTVPKNFIGRPFYFIQNFQYRNALWIRGGR